MNEKELVGAAFSYLTNCARNDLPTDQKVALFLLCQFLSGTLKFDERIIRKIKYFPLI